MKQTILITGAGGNIGFETLKEFLKKKDKYNIKAFDLKPKNKFRKIKSFLRNVQYIRGDITNYNDVYNAVKDSDFIIHTAALIPPAADKNTKLAKKINISGTENMCNAINEINPDIFLLFTSSISVYGDRIKNPEIRISDKLNPSENDYYAYTKIKAEEIIKVNLKNFAIFRLSAVMHPKMKLNPLLFHMPLDTKLEIITVKDTAFALSEAISKKDYLNNCIFNLGGGEKCRILYKNFLSENFKLFGLKQLDFPKHSFAEKNFHCGYYKDSFVLNEIINFQRDSIEDYFCQVKKSINPISKFITNIFNKSVKKQLLKKSAPYNAYIRSNSNLMKHFFNKISA